LSISVRIFQNEHCSISKINLDFNHENRQAINVVEQGTLK